ncbi:LPXTG cell wall anchor domain-containing protein [Lactococcus cremoris]
MNTLPETGDNGKTNISFILAGIIMISSAAILLYKIR